MKTITRTERVGEWLGPVDWSYNFRQHFDSMGCSDKGRDEECEKIKERLRKIEAEPDRYEVTTYGGWPRCGWGPVIKVGMFDGWPYWKPVPSVAYRTFLGMEETCFRNITNIRDIRTGEIS